jgi:hypothetical protein
MINICSGTVVELDHSQHTYVREVAWHIRRCRQISNTEQTRRRSCLWAIRWRATGIFLCNVQRYNSTKYLYIVFPRRLATVLLRWTKPTCAWEQIIGIASNSSVHDGTKVSAGTYRCKICGFHDGDYEECLRGCYAVWPSKNLVFLRSVRRLLVTASVVPSSRILIILVQKALSSSETSVLTRAIRRYIPEGAILQVDTDMKVTRIFHN